MQIDRLFGVLVVQGALLGAGCVDGEATDDEDRDSVADPDPTEEDGECADAVCENTDSWVDCTADGVTCCWATAVCCDVCCGDAE